MARRSCSRRPTTWPSSATTSRSHSPFARHRSRSGLKPDPRRFLVGYTGLVVDINTRLAPIYEAVRGAASADPEVRDVFEAIGAERRVGAGRVVRDLVAKGGRLLKGLDTEEAADILWVLIDAGLFHLLVHQRGWPIEPSSRGLADTIERELLA